MPPVPAVEPREAQEAFAIAPRRLVMGQFLPCANLADMTAEERRHFFCAALFLLNRKILLKIRQKIKKTAKFHENVKKTYFSAENML